MKYPVDREIDSCNASPAQTEPGEIGTFVVIEDACIVLRVWRDPASGRWFGSGKYA